jgi:hypothetical protein
LEALLRHPKPNIIIIFTELRDHRNCPADDFQYRRSLAVDLLPVSPSSLSLQPLDQDLADRV